MGNQTKVDIMRVSGERERLCNAKMCKDVMWYNLV